MAANELAKSLSLIMAGYLWTNSGNARRCFLSMKQPTGSYGCDAVSSVCRKGHIRNLWRIQAVSKQSVSLWILLHSCIHVFNDKFSLLKKTRCTAISKSKLCSIEIILRYES